MNNPGPSVVIILLNWNGKELLRRCVASLSKTRGVDHAVVIVDNGSTDGSPAFAREIMPAADIIALKWNTSYSAANNAGIKFALERYDPGYILLLSNDTEIVQENWLTRMVETAEQDPACGIVGCRLVYPDGRPQHSGSMITPDGSPGVDIIPGWTMPAAPYTVDAMIGAVFLIRRQVIDAIGLLDEGFNPYQAEDLDYCARARTAGFTVTIVPDVQVVHYTYQTLGREPTAKTLLATRKNMLRFRLLNVPFSWILRYLLLEARYCAGALLEKKDEKGGVSFTNLRFRKGCLRTLGLLCRAYAANALSIFDIIAKRYNRTGRLWY